MLVIKLWSWCTLWCFYLPLGRHRGAQGPLKAPGSLCGDCCVLIWLTVTLFERGKVRSFLIKFLSGITTGVPVRECRHRRYAAKYRDLAGGDRLNQHCVNSFGKGLNVTGVHLHVKVLHSSFNCHYIPNLSNYKHINNLCHCSNTSVL